MGGLKNQQIIDEEKRQIAIDVGLQAKVLKRCEAHETVMCAAGVDATPAYKLANALVTQGDPRVAAFKGDRKELTDLITAAVDEHNNTCYACEKAMED